MTNESLDLNLLQNDLQEAMDNLPLASTHDCCFQQDGAPVHNARIVTNCIMGQFPEKWIGTHSTVP